MADEGELGGEKVNGLNVNWEHIADVLALLFVISVVFETALTPIFNWRVFARHCEGKGFKTPITIVAAVVLLWSYDIDIFRHIIEAFSSADPNASQAESVSNVLGRLMTGFLVAGGSGAIFNIFTKLGLRNPEQLAAKAAQAREQAQKVQKDKEIVA